MIAIAAAFLAAAALAGCKNKQPLEIAVTNIPLPATALMTKIRSPRCETPGKGDLSVPDLENERDCYMSAEQVARSKHARLAASVRQTAGAVRKLRKISKIK